ncbi:very-short-patch-repair endonuclease [Sphingomonas vulcanisoli]|uniref:Very-short-patch-repair endonuclease n=1 Tax=Sphingomonas vulcanisoli TaxID=1658060 RepID=A0ABX0TVM0_9SPHN|nr:endonuclease domain-containing protein [Sphingomonas vulcanisoli]NIJ07825.1 very-short-patch-repair endonuclease [Sphingomonas vulcanisoli]
MLQGLKHVGGQARSLRQDMSLPEVLLWRLLRQRPAGLKFRRQHPSGPYVADFYCHEARLIVEIDGEAHNFGDRPARDAVRDCWFEARGLTVFRLSAADVLRNVDAAADAITCAAQVSCPGEDHR